MTARRCYFFVLAFVSAQAFASDDDKLGMQLQAQAQRARELRDQARVSCIDPNSPACQKLAKEIASMSTSMRATASSVGGGAATEADELAVAPVDIDEMRTVSEKYTNSKGTQDEISCNESEYGGACRSTRAYLQKAVSICGSKNANKNCQQAKGQLQQVTNKMVEDEARAALGAPAGTALVETETPAP
jgi:hypothetical protein